MIYDAVFGNFLFESYIQLLEPPLSTLIASKHCTKFCETD